MKNRRIATIDINELTQALEELNIKKKDAYELCGASKTQMWRWTKQGKMPAENFWAFQNKLSTYFIQEMVKKMIRLKLFDEEFLEELKDMIKKENETP